MVGDERAPTEHLRRVLSSSLQLTFLYRGWVVVGGVCGGQQGIGESCYERKRDLLEVGGCSPLP